MTDGPLSDLFAWLPILFVVAVPLLLIYLFVMVNFLRGRLDTQTQMIGVMINAIKRLEEEIQRK